MSHKTPMPGKTAPAIDAKSGSGGTFTLSTAPEGGFSVVFFYRGVHCPVCKTQIHELAQEEAVFREAGIAVSAVSMDDEERVARQRDEWDLGDLTFGHALTEESARAWWLYLSDKATDSEPARFAEPGIAVIRPDGVIYALYLQNTPFARPHLENLRKGLGFIMENDCPVRGMA